jgi:hypothetical protein
MATTFACMLKDTNTMLHLSYAEAGMDHRRPLPTQLIISKNIFLQTVYQTANQSTKTTARRT